MSNFFKVWSIYRTGVSKRSGANKRSRLMKDLSERLEESEEDGVGWNSQEDENASNRALLPLLAKWKLQVSKIFCLENRDAENKWKSRRSFQCKTAHIRSFHLAKSSNSPYIAFLKSFWWVFQKLLCLFATFSLVSSSPDSWSQSGDGQQRAQLFSLDSS